MNFPNHIALIPDGNRRWAQLNGVPALEGHRAGANIMHKVVDYFIETDLKYLTLWGFSIDNWKRSQSEIANIFQLIADWLEREVPWLNRNDVQLRHIGRLGELSSYLQLAVNQAVELTRNNNGMILIVAFNYGGRTELIDAMRRLLDENVPSRLVNEEMIRGFLYMEDMPDVDLVIRTAGEIRLSNFLLWQTAYSEYYFTKVLWPDFDTEELEMALWSYNERERRLGGD